jgi:O-methyltransferase
MEISQARNTVDTELYFDLLERCLVGYLYPESSHGQIRPSVAMAFPKRFLVQLLLRYGYRLMKFQPFDALARASGHDWPSIGYSMIGLTRLRHLRKCVEQAIDERIPGDLIEAGVWRGGACILMRAVLKAYGVTDRTVWLADSFAGLPVPSADADAGYDLSGNSYLAVSQEEVMAAFERFDLLDNQVQFLKGWFRDTLPTAPIERLAVLRLDGDLYESTMDALNGLYYKVSGGGFVIVDDYGDWPPCQRAVDEFRAAHKVHVPIQRIDEHGIFWRAV